VAPLSEFVSLVVSDGSQDAGLAMLLLSRPPTNAMTRQVYREITAAATELGRREDVAAVILFGGHEIFSAGDDMPELRTLTVPEADVAARVRREAVDAVAAIPKPTVAAITGYALGAGLTLALAADWRVSGDNVKFGATEILAGLIPGGGGMARLTRRAGPSRAKELVFSGRFFDAEEAFELGLIDEMVAPDDVYDAAAAWARRFLDGPRHALAAAKADINSVFDDVPGLDPAERLVAERRRYVEVFAVGRDGGGPDQCGAPDDAR
jgi:enoyl-CoA hydratase